MLLQAIEKVSIFIVKDKQLLSSYRDISRWHIYIKKPFTPTYMVNVLQLRIGLQVIVHQTCKPLFYFFQTVDYDHFWYSTKQYNKCHSFLYMYLVSAPNLKVVRYVFTVAIINVISEFQNIILILIFNYY